MRWLFDKIQKETQVEHVHSTPNIIQDRSRIQESDFSLASSPFWFLTNYQPQRAYQSSIQQLPCAAFMDPFQFSNLIIKI